MQDASPARAKKGVNSRMIGMWMQYGTRFLPFADVASEDLPLSKLLRLSLIQVSVGIALVLLVGTLNRVMIVELKVPATLVGIMLSLPLLFAPFRALIGHRSDTHQSALGWRRVPFIYRGTMLQWGGLAIMPFALLVLGGAMQSGDAPVWIGRLAAGLAFLLLGAGIHITQTVGLALATDMAPEEQQPNVVGLMYVMLLLGSIVAALAFGWALQEFSPTRLVQVISSCAVATGVLNLIALWKQEARNPVPPDQRTQQQPFREAWSAFIVQHKAVRRLLAIGFGTLAFSMADILLEPYGGEILGMNVGTTTYLSAILAGGSLIGFAYASYVLSLGADPFRMAALGAVIGLPAFALVILAAEGGETELFTLGVLLAGGGTGLFSHGTLTATMRLAPRDQIGMAMGAWGAVQATAQGVGAAVGGIIRDTVKYSGVGGTKAAANGYLMVYGVELVMLVVTLAVMVPLFRRDAPAAA